jgi:hypothetical protein
MADYYVDFSVMIDPISDEEWAWITAHSRKILAQYDYGADLDDVLGRREPEGWWLASENCWDNADMAAQMIHDFLRHFKRNDIVILEVAIHCSKPRPGEFGGAAYVLSREKFAALGTGDWAWRQAEKIKDRRAKKGGLHDPLLP